MAKREIKFRGKRVHNGEWVYGYYVRHETRQICPIGDDKLKLEEIKHLIVVDSFADWNMPRQLQGIEVIPKTVGQYTGLEDREGVEIYEGDVIQEFAGEHVQGVWEFSNVSVVEDLRCIPESLGFADCTYIIGSIHENPELIGKKK